MQEEKLIASFELQSEDDNFHNIKIEVYDSSMIYLKELDKNFIINSKTLGWLIEKLKKARSLLNEMRKNEI